MVITLMILSLVGCEKSASGETTTVTGEVASLGSDTMVINVADDSMTKRPDGVSGGAIKGERPDGVSGGAIREDEKGQKPEGTPPADSGNKGGRGFATTGETKTIKLTEDTKVIVKKGQESSEGTMSDVSLGTIVQVTLDSDGETAVSITVNSFGGGLRSQSQAS